MKSEFWTFDGNSVLDTKGENACTKANGVLIAASPYMLKALQSIVAILDGRQPKDIPGAIMAAKSAIDKATPCNP